MIAPSKITTVFVTSLSLCVLLALAACGDSQPTTTTTEESTTTTPSNLTALPTGPTSTTVTKETTTSAQ